MKKVIFTAILSLVLGTAWMLYLESDNRRFIEQLPKLPANVTRPVDTADAPVTPESGETITTATSPLEPASDTQVADRFTERVPVQPETYTDGTSQTETTDFLSEENMSETVFEDVAERSTRLSAKEFLMKELGLSEAEIDAKKEAYKDLNRLFWAKPENWASGRPGEVGFRFEVWTKEDHEVIRRALGSPPLPPALPEQTPAVKMREPQLPAHEVFPEDD